jgi:amino acid synthesis protein
MNLRKLSLTKETIFADAGRLISQPITRAVAVAIVDNPFADRFADDLSPLFADGAELGRRVMPELASLLSRSAVAYGKAAIVGVGGEIEHGAAMLHPRLGQPMRDAVGGGQAIISSNVKIGGPGTSIDVPLAHKDNIWSFDHLDTVTISSADAPRPDEIVVIMAISDGGRPHPRVGKGRV